ncbi:hypothetical protein ACJMK2_009872 [Sinanodonta woodiana]|uniref:TNF family profile domain-containing protein n=1 Tax=Sinanodonta woodiana TaxID=1069815 RepID=A0ABD3VDL4_SINWO
MTSWPNEHERCSVVPELISTKKRAISSKLCRHCCQMCFIPCLCVTVFLFIVALVVRNTDILNIVKLCQGNVYEEKLQAAEPMPASMMLADKTSLKDMAATARTSAQLFFDKSKTDNERLHWTYDVPGASKTSDLTYEYYKEFGCLKISTPGYYLVMFKIMFNISGNIAAKDSYINIQIREENQPRPIIVYDRFDFPEYNGRRIYFSRINFGYFQLSVSDIVCITMPPEHISLVYRALRATTFNLHRF